MSFSDFYRVTSSSFDDKTMEVQLDLNNTHPIYKGHFPKQPVLPGVLLLQIVKECVADYTKCALQLVEARQVKFLTVINPEDSEKLWLSLKIEGEEGRIKVSGKAFHREKTAAKMSLLFKRI